MMKFFPHLKTLKGYADSAINKVIPKIMRMVFFDDPYLYSLIESPKKSHIDIFSFFMLYFEFNLRNCMLVMMVNCCLWRNQLIYTH